jgi:hypothetical protein
MLTLSSVPLSVTNISEILLKVALSIHDPIYFVHNSFVFFIAVRHYSQNNYCNTPLPMYYIKCLNEILFVLMSMLENMTSTIVEKYPLIVYVRYEYTE